MPYGYAGVLTKMRLLFARHITLLISTILVMFTLAGCNVEQQSNSNVQNELTAKKINPIEIQGVSFANTLATNRTNFSKNVGCEFHGAETERNCCFHPHVFADDSKQCIDYDGRITNTVHYFKCNTYSSCQYTTEEVKEILANKYNLKFTASCAVSALGSRICVSMDENRRNWTQLGPDIKLERHKFSRSHNL